MIHPWENILCDWIIAQEVLLQYILIPIFLYLPLKKLTEIQEIVLFSDKLFECGWVRHSTDSPFIWELWWKQLIFKIALGLRENCLR